jgi:hypothetical protein
MGMLYIPSTKKNVICSAKNIIFFKKDEGKTQKSKNIYFMLILNKIHEGKKTGECSNYEYQIIFDYYSLFFAQKNQ